METKISKAQIEVWDWKDSLFEELKNIPKLERLNYIKGKVKNTIEKINKKKNPRKRARLSAKIKTHLI